MTVRPGMFVAAPVALACASASAQLGPRHGVASRTRGATGAAVLPTGQAPAPPMSGMTRQPMEQLPWRLCRIQSAERTS